MSSALTVESHVCGSPGAPAAFSGVIASFSVDMGAWEMSSVSQGITGAGLGIGFEVAKVPLEGAKKSIVHFTC